MEPLIEIENKLKAFPLIFENNNEMDTLVQLIV